jgi:hypothetical protein
LLVSLWWLMILKLFVFLFKGDWCFIYLDVFERRGKIPVGSMLHKLRHRRMISPTQYQIPVCLFIISSFKLLFIYISRCCLIHVTLQVVVIVCDFPFHWMRNFFTAMWKNFFMNLIMHYIACYQERYSLVPSSTNGYSNPTFLG